MENISGVQEQINALVSRVMTIESVTLGGQEEKITAHYRGTLRKDSMEAYDQLAEALKRYQLTPLFRKENEQDLILLMRGVFDSKPSNPWINLILFLLTLFSVLFAGTMYSYDGPVPEGGLGGQLLVLVKNLHVGIPFGLSILAILLAHEFGHYLAARYHKSAVTLPYFIPLPISPFGTMGAFIQLKEPPKNRRTLHDIGIAGPLAGLVVAIPILLIGLALSPVEVIEPVAGAGGVLMVEGNSIFYLAAKYFIHGELLPAPESYGGISPVLYWLRYVFTGFPAPFGARDVLMHPLAWAGWAGLLVTALNLIPVGQLDGGHALYVLFGRKARRMVPIVLIALALLGFAWQGWWLWVVLIFFLGQRHAEPLDQITPLDSTRRAIAIAVLVLFAFIFIPIPLQQYVGG
ncbi:MAG: site-2 protease family protein [Anaerolineales bacterium]|jgi:Zn-dependent protease